MSGTWYVHRRSWWQWKSQAVEYFAKSRWQAWWFLGTSVELYYLLCKMRRLEQMIFKILQFFHGFLHLFLWIFKPWGLKEWAMPKKSKARATGRLAYMIGPTRIFLGHFFTPASVDRLCLILAEGEWKTTLVGSESRERGLRFNLMRLASVLRSQRTQRSRWQTQIT